jgi:plasmid stabilization system protein ParE
LKEAFDYISLDRPEAARNWVRQVLTGIEKLTRFSKIGRVIPEIGQSRYRELIVGEYRIFQEITAKQTRIFRILHAKRFFEL